MNFKKYRSRFLLVFAALTLLFSSVLLTSCQGKKIKNTVFSVDDLAGKTIGVQLGTTGDTLVSDYETDGSGTTVSRYNKGSDAIQALKQGKADADDGAHDHVLHKRPVFENLHNLFPWGHFGGG